MSVRFAKGLLGFLVPGGLVLLAAVGFLRPHGLPEWLHQPASAIPFIVLAFGLVFGWHLSSSRLIWSLAVLAMAERAVTIVPPTGENPQSLATMLFAITAFFLPLNLLGLSLVKEEAFSWTGNLIRLALLCMQVVFILWLCSPDGEDLAVSLTRNSFGWMPIDWTPVPQPALVMFGLAGALHLTQYVAKRDPVEAGAFWSLAAAFLAFHGTQSGWRPTNFFSAAGFILFLSVLQSMHRRAYRDELTGIAGQQAYEEAIQRLKSRYAFAVLAPDQLKSYAGAHGRSVAEQVLKLIAPLIQSACRGATVYRVSGEELLILFPGFSAVETLPALETIRKTVEATSLILSDRDRVRTRGRRPLRDYERELTVTISGGVAEHASGATLTAVQRAAYRALYEAKSAGGNVMKRGIVTLEESRRPLGIQGRIVAHGEH